MNLNPHKTMAFKNAYLGGKDTKKIKEVNTVKIKIRMVMTFRGQREGCDWEGESGNLQDFLTGAIFTPMNI